MKNHLALVAGLIGLSLASAGHAEPGPPVSTAIDAVAARYRDVPVTGMTIAVLRDGQPVHVRGYGLSDLEGGVPASADTVYEIGSITKEFTAAAILRLAERGALRLDDPVAQWFPELETAAQGATLRHLLSHTSGLFSGPLTEDATLPVDPAATVAALAAAETEFRPGERYSYNNNAYVLLGLLIERLGGKPYGDVLRDEFFGPLGLGSTSICNTPRDPGTARAYIHPTRGDATPSRHPVHHPSVSYSAGSICSTAGDVAIWQTALATGRVVSPDSFALMSTPPALASGRTSPYGLGLYSDERSGERHLHHGGAASGFITQAGYYPADGTTVVVLTNGLYSGAIVEQIEAAVLRASRGQPDDAPLRLPLTAAERAAYVGAYRMGPMTVEVYEQGEDLRARPGDQVAARLFHQGDGVFVAEHDPALRLTFHLADGRADEVVFSQGGRALPPARRVTE